MPWEDKGTGEVGGEGETTGTGVSRRCDSKTGEGTPGKRWTVGSPGRVGNRERDVSPTVGVPADDGDGEVRRRWYRGCTTRNQSKK